MKTDFNKINDYWDLKMFISLNCKHKINDLSCIKCSINGEKCLPSIRCVELDEELLKNDKVRKHYNIININLRSNKLKNLIDNIKDELHK